MYSFNFNKVSFIVIVALFWSVEAGDLGGYGYGDGQAAYGYGDGYDGQGDNYEYPKYQFNYAVNDPHTGDEKQHVEERDGDEVRGTYTLKEADGTTRVVEYRADKQNGFNAVVHKIGQPQQDGGYGKYY